MGYKYEIYAYYWSDDFEEYRDNEFWRGESFIAAMYQLLKAKSKGYGCVTFYLR